MSYSNNPGQELELSEIYMENARDLVELIRTNYDSVVDFDGCFESLESLPASGEDVINLETDEAIIGGMFQIRENNDIEDYVFSSDAWIRYSDPNGNHIIIEERPGKEFSGSYGFTREGVEFVDFEELSDNHGELDQGEFWISYHDMESDNVRVYRGDLRRGAKANWQDLKQILN